MSFTFIHTADLHLGKSFSTLPPERAEQRRADLLATLTRLCRHACATRVELLCITGDLFDRALPPVPLVAAVRAALAEASVPVLLAPGNHDALVEHSPYFDARWPGNVQIATQPGWQRMPADVELWAFGYARGAAHASPWAQFPGCAADAVLALHASCLAPGLAVDAGYFPFSPPEIPPCGYLALGHHHRAAQVNHQPVAWYAGSPEPLAPEVTPAAVLQVALHGGVATVTPQDVTTRHHRLVTLDVSGCTGEEIWERALAVSAPDDLLTLQLVGLLELTTDLDIAALQNELSARYFAAEVQADDLCLPNEAPHAEGALAALHALAHARLRNLAADDPQRIRVQRALRYAALALEGRL